MYSKHLIRHTCADYVCKFVFKRPAIESNISGKGQTYDYYRERERGLRSNKLWKARKEYHTNIIKSVLGKSCGNKRYSHSLLLRTTILV